MQVFMAKKLSGCLGKILALPVLVSALAVNMGCAAAATGTPPVIGPVANPQPCDLLAAATPCVAAISTTRALYSEVSGALYQVTRESDKATSGHRAAAEGMRMQRSRMLSARRRRARLRSSTISRRTTTT